jgi:prepilin peptidase CpaA
MTYKHIIIDSILLIALIIAVITDLKSRKIYDKLTIPTAIIGLALNGIFFGLSGLKNSSIGWVVGVAIFMLFGLGGGDVKLLGAVGALKGWLFTLTSIVYIGISGGILVVIYLIWTGKMLKTLINAFSMIFKRSEFKKEENEKIYLPYGPMILIGIIWNYLAINFNFLSLFKY